MQGFGCIITRKEPHNKKHKWESGTRVTYTTARGDQASSLVAADWILAVFMGDSMEKVKVDGHIYVTRDDQGSWVKMRDPSERKNLKPRGFWVFLVCRVPRTFFSHGTSTLDLPGSLNGSCQLRGQISLNQSFCRLFFSSVSKPSTGGFCPAMPPISIYGRCTLLTTQNLRLMSRLN